jgi:hypothetical protein
MAAKAEAKLCNPALVARKAGAFPAEAAEVVAEDIIKGQMV